MAVPVAAVAAIVTAVASAVQAVAGGTVKQAEAEAFNTVEDANAYAGNLVRASSNALKGSRAELARYVQAENNRRVLDNTGRALGIAEINARRAHDRATADNFESQIAFAEQAGAQVAAAAFSGLQGGVVDIVNSTTALRRARTQQRTKEALITSDYDVGQQRAGILQQGWDNLDQSDIGVDLDYGKNIALRRAYSGNLFSELVSSISPQTAGGLSSMFQSSPSRPWSYGPGSASGPDTSRASSGVSYV